MSEMISVYWPSGGTLSPEEWRQRLECLATRAEGLVGKRDVPVQQRAAMALEWVGLAWVALSPDVIAGSARAALLLGEPVVMAAAPADQLAEIHESLDEIWELARRDPEAAVVSIGPPLLERVRERGGRARRPAAAVEPAAEPELEPAAEPPEPSAAPDPDELPAAWRQALDPEPAVIEPPEPVAAEPVVPAPAAPAPEVEAPPDPPPPPPEPEPIRVAIPTGFVTARDLALELEVNETAVNGWCKRNLEPEDVFQVGRRRWWRRAAVLSSYIPQPLREPAVPRRAAPPPPGWLNTDQVMEVMQLAKTTVCRLRSLGQLGAEGEDWRRCGKTYFFRPEAIEEAMDRRLLGMSQILDEIRAEQ